MKRTFLGSVFLVISISGQILAATVDEYADQLKVLDPDMLSKFEAMQVLPCECRKDGKPKNFGIWKLLSAIKEEANNQKILRGKASFGFTGDGVSQSADSQDKNPGQTTVNSGLELKRGSYPGKFTFNVDVGLRLSKNKVQEDVSKIKASYDYYTTEWLMPFTFVERFSDSFMNIDQRYEVGFGAYFSRTFLKIGKRSLKIREKGKEYSSDIATAFETLKEEEKKLKESSSQKPKKNADWRDDGWYECYRKLAPKESENLKKDEFLEQLEDWIKEAGIAQKKRNALITVGVSSALFRETEKATIKREHEEEVKTTEGPKMVAIEDTFPVDAAHRYRLSVRPTLEVQPSDRWSLLFRWYWKIPVGQTRGDRLLSDGTLKEVLDYRSDLESSLTYSVKGVEFGQPGDVDVTLRYQRFFDNAPPLFIEKTPYRSAPDTHNVVSLTLGVKW